MSISKKGMAIDLRKRGFSYNYISKVTKLSKSTLSYHLSKVPYQANEYTINKIQTARSNSHKTKLSKKELDIRLSRQKARMDINSMSKRDLFFLGIGLYIGEGSKTQNLVRLVNSDPRAIRLFIKWVKNLGVKESNLALRVHLYPTSDVKIAEKFWLKETGLPEESLQKSCIDMRVDKKLKKDNLRPYGTAHVTVRAMGNKSLGTHLSRVIGAYMEEVLQ